MQEPNFRSQVWNRVLMQLIRDGEFLMGDLGFAESKRHTVRRVLKDMEKLGWLQRDSPQARTWQTGEKAAIALNLQHTTEVELTAFE